MEVLQRTANRGSVSTGYDVDNSVKFDKGNDTTTVEFFERNVSSAGSRTTGTFSAWVKKTDVTTAQYLFTFGNVDNDDGRTFARFQTDGTLRVAGGSTTWRNTNRVFRDTAAWYHIVVAFDTTQSTANDRIKVYVNGVQETSFSTTNNPSEDGNLGLNFGKQAIGYNTVDNNSGFNGYMCEVVIQDGVASAPTEFGEFDSDTGIWIPKDASGATMGTNGSYLKFENASSMGAATAGNAFTVQNINQVDQATDTCTNNFCTLNILSYNIPYTASQGNTKYVKNDNTYGMASGTHYVGAGKWYWEIKATDFGTYSSCSFGIIDAFKPTVDANERGYEDPVLAATNPDILVMSGAPNNWFMNSNGTISNNGSTGSVDYTFNEGDILAFALDMDNGAYWMGNSRYSGVANGSFWVAPGGTTTSGSVATTDPTNGNYALIGDGGGTNSGTPNFNGGTITGGSLLTAGFTLVTPLLGAYHSNTEVTLEVNFGGFTSYGEDGGYSDANGHGNFAYAVPSGFYSLCSKNIAEFGGSG